MHALHLLITRGLFYACFTLNYERFCNIRFTLIYGLLIYALLLSTIFLCMFYTDSWLIVSHEILQGSMHGDSVKKANLQTCLCITVNDIVPK